MKNNPSWIRAKIFNKYRKYALAALILLAASLIVLNFENIVESQEQKEADKQIETLQLENFKQAETEITTIGQIKPYREVKLSSKISAEAINLNARLGDRVSAGNLLIELEHEGLDAQVQQAQARVKQARGNLAQKVVGATTDEIQQAAARVEQARSSVQQAQSQLEKTRVVSENRVETARIKLQQASSTDSNKNVSNLNQLRNATESGVNTAQAEVSNALQTFSVVTDIQYEYFNNNSQQSLRLAEKKRSALSDFVGAEDAGRWRFEFIADKKDGIRGEIDRLAEQKSYDPDNVIQTLNDLSLVLQSIKTLLNETLVALNSVNNPDPQLKQELNQAIATVNQSVVNISSARQKIKQAKIQLNSSDESTNLSYEEAYNNFLSTQEETDKDITSAEAALRTKQAALREAQNAYDQLVSSPRAVDIQPLRAALSEVRANLRSVIDQRSNAFLRAPISGRISKVNIEEGEVANPNSTLLNIVNTSRLEAEAHLSPDQLKTISLNEEVQLENGGIARITRISPAVDNNTGKIEVELVVEADTADYTPGEYIELTIETTESTQEDSGYLLPFSAVNIQPEQNFIYYINQAGKVAKQQVKLDRVIGERVLIKNLGEITEIINNTDQAQDLIGQQVKTNQKDETDQEQKSNQQLNYLNIFNFPKLTSSTEETPAIPKRTH
jgi:multidrug resistance efflux pump